MSAMCNVIEAPSFNGIGVAGGHAFATALEASARYSNNNQVWPIVWKPLAFDRGKTSMC